MVDAYLEVRWKWISVSEDILHYASVGSCRHGMESAAVFDLVYVGPGREVDVCILLESLPLSVDDEIHMTFSHDDDQMIFGAAWLGIDYVILTLYLTGKDIVVDITYALDTLFSEKNSRTRCFLSFFVHFCTIMAQM